MNYRMIDFQQHGDARGMLVAMEGGKEIPFKVRRVYYMYDTGETVRCRRHVHRKLEQILICVHGSCRIHLNDGTETDEVFLNKPDVGLYLSQDIWREIYDFSNDAVLLVLASENYDESDYIKEDYKEFSGKNSGSIEPSYRMMPLEAALFQARSGLLFRDKNDSIIDKPYQMSKNIYGSCKIGIVDGMQDIPFDIQRAFYIYNTVEGVVRGCHSNRKSQFALICLSGTCRVRVRKSDDQNADEIFLLDKPDKVLVLSVMAWKEMYDFRSDTVLLCLSSEKYDAQEYVRDFSEFLEFVNDMG